MKKACCLILAMLCASTAFAQNAVWFDGSFDAAMSKAAAEGKLIVVDFYSDG